MPQPNVKISEFLTDDVLTGSELLTGIDGNTNKNISVLQIANFVIAMIGGVTQLTTPTFDVTVMSDSEIHLENIDYDAASETLIVHRSEDPDFPPGYVEVYNSTPTPTIPDTGLDASTLYYYRVGTTATGYINSEYGLGSGTTTGGSGDTLIMGSSGDTLILSGSGDTLILA